MRENLLGLPLEEARARLEAEGIQPQIMQTCAPRQRERAQGRDRVVYASDDGRRLTVARFLDPFDKNGQENG